MLSAWENSALGMFISVLCNFRQKIVWMLSAELVARVQAVRVCMEDRLISGRMRQPLMSCEPSMILQCTSAVYGCFAQACQGFYAGMDDSSPAAQCISLNTRWYMRRFFC
ncbi:hypothetical protein CO2235_70106 [Cupriavidus oxalaticus]|uniref:Uncharacterized protein n=1 Tax=Cupriavidus oxalaticus TaxID=96344 RepID=A0A375GCD8_9BURK|nr:hypothetical protein CO2235_70106 [Cupriavidus oxalaticus]